MTDSLGDRIKGYEREETSPKFLPNVPVIARIDGRCFSALTKSMHRPFDDTFSWVMREVMKHLVKETGACIGYTQSDEINLCWYQPKPGSEIFFNGRKFKMVSQLAAMASVEFCRLALTKWPEWATERLPTFDARVFQVPTLDEGVNALLWRQRDCRKNAVSMVARSMYSHKALDGCNTTRMLELIEIKGFTYENYPWQAREGVFASMRDMELVLSQQELSAIPKDRHPTKPIMRSRCFEFQLPMLSELQNATDVIFFGADPL